MSIQDFAEIFFGALLGILVHFLKWQSQYQAGSGKTLSWQEFYMQHGAETLTMAIFSLAMIVGLPEISGILNQFVQNTWNIHTPVAQRDFFWCFCVGYMSDSVSGWLGAKFGGNRFKSLAGDIPSQ